MVGARSLLRSGWPLLALALAVRIAQIVATHDWVPVADPADYVRHAQSIADGHGMAVSFVAHGGPSAFRPPAYPYFLGGVFALTGDSLTAGRVASALLGVVSVALIGVIAQALWDRRAALSAMGIAAIYPPFVLLSGTLLSESLGLPLALAALTVVLACRNERWAAPVSGVLFGLALLTRPASVAFAIPLIVALWGRRAVVALAVTAITLVPWTIRNAIDFDAFVPIATDAGFLLGGTYNQTTDHDPAEPGAYRPANFDPALRAILEDRSLDEHEVDQKLAKAGRRYAQDHPGYVPRVFWFNTLRLAAVRHGRSWTRYSYAFQGIGTRSAQLARFGWYLLALAALAAIAFGVLRRELWWLWVVPLLLVLTTVWTSGDVRYRIPIEAFAILAAGALGRG
jgi:4-amino-4-deoxy-L-arabinose transferase-like glycosyltransferase